MGVLILPWGKASLKDAERIYGDGHKSLIKIDGQFIDLGDDELRTAEKVADRIRQGVSYSRFADEEIFKNEGKSYRAHPYKIQKANGKGTAECGVGEKVTERTVCLRFERIFPGTAGNGTIEVTGMDYSPYNPYKKTR